MAVLPNAERIKVWERHMRANLGLVGVTKADLRAAVDALDAFTDANAAAINSALPQPARGALTTAQKAILLMYVVEQRYLAGV